MKTMLCLLLCVLVVACDKPADPPAPPHDGASAPAPSEPAPSEPAPSEPAPSEPAPSEPAPSEPTPSAPATCGKHTCTDGKQCVRYYGIAGPSGPEFTSCEWPCGKGGGCPAGTTCVTIADGPGRVCR